MREILFRGKRIENGERFLDAYDDTPLDMGEMWDDTEVIGNIHDNPEMLEGGADNV